MRDERGSGLVAAVGVLSALTLLATMSLMAGGADLVIATRLARERSAFYAAESALATAMEDLESGDLAIPDASLQAPWPPLEIAVRRWQDGAWACARRICLIPDAGDADVDPETTVVLFDRSFGYASSPLPRGGDPVLQLLVSAQSGESSQAIVAEVVPVTCAPGLAAAWTAAGPLHLVGDIQVSGTATVPAVAGRSPTRLSEGAAIDGEEFSDPLLSLPADVLEILNPGGTLSRLAELPEPPAGGELDGMYWSRGDYAGPLEGRGIFVAHNPAFDPVRHEASRTALEDGLFADGYDPAYSHLDPSRQPARVDITAAGSYRGVVIADVIGSASARFTLTGGLVTLTRSPVAVTAAAPLRIVASPAAVERSGRGALRHLVGFRPVTMTPEQTGRCP